MNIEDLIKKWVILDNNYKKLFTNIKTIKEEKNELTNNIINYFDSKEMENPTIKISNGKLNIAILKHGNIISYKFLTECFEEFFEDKEISEKLLEYIKSKRIYSTSKNIKRIYL